MQFTTLPQIAHPDIALRPIRFADLETWYAYLSQPLVFEHTSWNLSSPDELATYVDGAVPVTASSRLRLAVVTRADDRLIGTAGFHTVMPENRSAEITYDLVPALWGRGIASAVCRALTDWAHEHAGLLRVQATVLQSNARSAKLLERCGYQREGLLRSYRQVRGRPGDFFIYAHITRDR